MAKFEQGQPKKGGRQKGTGNKTPIMLREMILGALDELGGQEYLKRQAILNPVAFLTLIGKVLPKDVNASVTGANGGPVRTINVIELVPFESDK